MDPHVIPNEYEINFKDLNLAARPNRKSGICNEKDVWLNFFSEWGDYAIALQSTDLIHRNS